MRHFHLDLQGCGRLLAIEEGGIPAF